MKNLFQNENNYEDIKPLSLKLRPENFDEFVGQEKLIGKNGILRKLIENNKMISSVFFGPPGCGKSTLGSIISKMTNSEYVILNATTCSVDDIKNIVEKAQKNIEYYGKKTILFLDEIHRFNKKQQDSLLSYCEDGIITLIGATTENPYYSLNNALLSRIMVFEFEKLTKKDLEKILLNGIKKLDIKISDEIKNCILEISAGDSRILLNYLELYQKCYGELADKEILEIFSKRKNSYHKEEDKYNLISAMIKSIRGSDPDSAIYWLARLLDGGEDPRFIARRLSILASEDIGMANPEAMLIANSTLIASERIGMPEIRIILAQAVIYTAISTKSNSCYNAINLALEDIRSGDLEKVPENIQHNHRGYLYPHSYVNNFIYQKYSNKRGRYYQPCENKNEKLIREKLERLWNNK